MSFIATKFHEILLSVWEEWRWQEKQDWLTDWRTAQKHYTLRNLLHGV